MHYADHLARWRVRDRRRGVALEANLDGDAIARLLQEAPYLFVADRLIGCKRRDTFCPERIKRGLQRRRPTGQPDPRTDHLAQPHFKLGVTFEAAPEGLRRHAHHDVAWLAGHDVTQRIRNGLADLLDEREEHVVA